jgi:hypothetical protein
MAGSEERIELVSPDEVIYNLLQVNRRLRERITELEAATPGSVDLVNDQATESES